MYTFNPACCQDYAICHFLRIRLIQLFQSLVTSSWSWSIWTQHRLRLPTRSKLGPTKAQCWLKCKDLCLISQELNEGVQKNWRRQGLSVLYEVVYFRVQEWLFHHQEESEQSRNCARYMYTQALQG